MNSLMVRDTESPLRLKIWIKLVEPELTPQEMAEEVHYLKADILDLNGLEKTRFSFSTISRAEEVMRDGVSFALPPDRLPTLLKRLCDRLDHRPLDTLVIIQCGQTKLQIQTHRADDLYGILAAAEALLPPDSIYLAKAEAYSRTRGEISPAEDAVLEVLRQRLNLDEVTAGQLKAKALGPYKTLKAKRQRFQEVLMIELARQSPLADDTWAVLQELADNLGLPQPEAWGIYQDQLQQIQAEAEALRQKQIAEAEAAQRRAEAERRRAAEEQQQGSRQEQLDQYQQMVRQALQNNLHPLTFDQGRLEQARQIWHISAEEASQMEETIRSEIYGSIDSAIGIDYSRLRQLLWEKAWQKADEETENVMLKALRQNMEPLDRDAILQLPCVDLSTIDQLWSRYSQGKFGFKAQQQAYYEVDRRPLDFLQLLAWRGRAASLNRGLKAYTQLQFNLGAPAGHLPTWRWCCPSLESGYEVSDSVVEAMFLHLDKCLSLGQPSPAFGPLSRPEGA